MKSYDNIFAELSKSTSNMLDSGLADPNEETNKILEQLNEETAKRLEQLIFQHDAQIRLAMSDAADAKKEVEKAQKNVKIDRALSIIAIGISIVFGILTLLKG